MSALGTTAFSAVRASIPLWAITAAAVGAAVTLLPAFRTTVSVGSLLASLAPLLFVATGQALVVMLGGIDLSVGAVVGLTTALVVTGTGWLGAVFALVVAGSIGAANGLGAIVGVNPLIMTLATAGIVQGVALMVLPQPGGVLSDAVATALTAQLGPVPVTFAGAVAALAVIWYLSAKSKFGVVLHAAGYQPGTARRIGLPWRRVTVLAYLASGLLAGFGGLAVVARIYSGDALAGSALVLDSVTAVLVGGMALTGGRGSILAVLPAAALLAVAAQVITLTGADPNYQYVISGLVLIFAMLVYRSGRPTHMLRDLARRRPK